MAAAGSNVLTVLLLDAYNLLFRAFCSIPAAVVDRDGQPINAVYGLMAALLRLRQETAAGHAVAAFDDPATPTFRHELFPAYQAQRGPMGGEHADDFARQVEIAFTAVPHLGIPALRRSRYEADDIMGTLARRLAAHGDDAVIVSTDRDLLQLVGPHIGVLVPGRELRLIADEAAVIEGIGVGPDFVTDYKALAGDASDNVPGIAGVGAKTAASLVNEYGHLESIFAHLDELPARARRALEGKDEEAQLYRRIVTVVTDLDLPLAIEDLPALAIDAGIRVRDVLDLAGIERPEKRET